MRWWLIIFACFLITGCEKFALLTTAKKKPVAAHSQLAIQAEQFFWDTLHSGDYAKISTAEKLLLAAYLENPNDPKLAAHLGFLHIWKITERQREKTTSPMIVDEIILAKKYFADSVELNPHDARIQGFLGDSMLIEGKIFHDKREEVRGYFKLQEAISMWPEFNYFSAGYPMTTLDVNTSEFKQALAWQWQTLDLCAGQTVDKNNPDYRPFMQRETQEGPKRACWNSWIAPHNFEGFFLNMGDMLVKQGNWQTAIKIYNNAKLSKTYAAWPYQNLLEERIQHAQENTQKFRQANSVMFNSGFGCVVCHQSSGREKRSIFFALS